MTDYLLIIDLDAPGGAPCLLDRYGDPLRSAPQFVAGDLVPVAVRFARAASAGGDPAAGVAYDEDGETQERWVSVGLRASASGPVLAAQAAFARQTFAVGEDDYYEHAAILDLNTVEADAATADGAVAVVLDIEVRDAAEAGSETRRLTWQAAATLNPQMYRAAEPAPAALPTPVTEANLTAMLRDGQIVLVDTVTSQAYQITVAGGTLRLVPVEEA